MTIQDSYWVERYRPETLDDIVGHEDSIERLKAYVGSSEMPHLLFHGPQGTGKTAASVALAKDIFGDSWRNNMMEINASDERGVDTVRNKIKDRAVQGPSEDYDFQLIFLDEADSLTSEAQAAFRRTMEDYADVTRFILSCNYPSQIIDPIQSRCAVLRFSPLSDEAIRTLIRKVEEGEELEVTDRAVEELVRASNGDARRAIHTLQDASITGDEITADSIDSIVGLIPEHEIESIISYAMDGELEEAINKLDAVLREGVDAQKVATAFHEVVKGLDVGPKMKRKLTEAVAEFDWRANRGANPNVQCHYLLTAFYAAAHAPPVGESKVPEDLEY